MLHALFTLARASQFIPFLCLFQANFVSLSFLPFLLHIWELSAALTCALPVAQSVSLFYVGLWHKQRVHCSRRVGSGGCARCGTQGGEASAALSSVFPDCTLCVPSTESGPNRGPGNEAKEYPSGRYV